jgi:hypothetical protein
MGTTYSFRIEARNTYGYSAYSSEVSVLAAAVPSTPSAPSTAMSGTNVIISWTLPLENGSSVSSYTVTIRQSDGSTYSIESTYCNGSSSSVVTARSCTIP